jgi:type I restriction enzyme, S subunit
MELKPGYKQTDVGIIPEDWDVSSLDLVSKLSSGTTPARAQEDRYYRNGKYHWVKTTDLNNSRITSTEEKITQSALDETCLQIYPPGTVFVAMYGGFNQIGRSGMLEIPAAVNQALIAIQTTSKKLDPLYLLASLNYRVEYWKSVASSSRKDPNITSQDVRNFVVPLPSLLEQRSIATALSDMDELLGGLDRLITKKRDLKQSAMQQLLTGKTRLPGFDGEWKETTLGEIGECIIGLTYKPENVVEHGLLVFRSSNVQNGQLAYENNVYVDLKVSEHLVTRMGDILICVRNGSRSLIGKCTVIDSDAAGLTFGAFMSVYRTNYWRFIAHAFQSHDIQRQIRDNIGATINQITNRDMKAFRVMLPPEEEQTEIASILSDMDTEIAALEQRRNKTRDLKQAMMQELLTGRIRLV